METIDRVLELLYQIKVSGKDVFRLADSITLLTKLTNERKDSNED